MYASIRVLNFYDLFCLFLPREAFMSSVVPSTLQIPSIFDRAQFMIRCMGNVALSEKLIATLLTTLPVDKTLLQGAIETKDMTLMVSLAHRLRGTAANVCAISLSESALRVEQAAREDQYDSVHQHWLELSGEIEKLLEELSLGVRYA